MKKCMILLTIALFCAQGMPASAQKSSLAKAIIKGSITSGAISLVSGSNPMNEAIKQAQSAANLRMNTNLGTVPFVQPQVITTPRTQAFMSPALKPSLTVNTNIGAFVTLTDKEFKTSGQMQSEKNRHLLHFLSEKMTPEWTDDSLNYYYEQYMQLEDSTEIRNMNSDIQDSILWQKSDMTFDEFDKNVPIEKE